MVSRRHLVAVLLVAGWCLACCPPALAYLDPGTQTQVVQILGMVLGAMGLAVGVLLWPFKRFIWWLRDRFGPRLAWAVFAATLALFVGGVVATALVLFGPERSGQERPEVTYTGSTRVIVLGMDGLDPNLMDELMKQGELPHFQILRETGTFTRLRTTLPPETPVAWSGIATGCNPGKHGIFDFLHRDPKTYKPILSIYRLNERNYADRRDKRYLPVRHAPGFWTPLSQAGVPVTVIRWPSAFPPEVVTGSFLSGLGVPDVRGRLGQYSFFTTQETEPAGFKGHWGSAPWEHNAFRSHLIGPVGSYGLSRKEAKLEVTVRKIGGGRISLVIQGAPAVELKAGDWSDFIPVRFTYALGRTVPAMVRAYLAAIDPELRLYVSTAELDPMEPYAPFTFPDGYAAELAEAIGRYTTLGMPEDVNAMKDGTLSPEAFEAAMLDLFDQRKKQFDYEFQRFDAGVFAFIFDAGDRIQHMFWRTRDKDHPNYDPEFARKYGHVIPDMYKRMDAVLGEVLAAADENTTVLVVSDHGFNTFRVAVGLNSWLVDQGYMVLKTPTGRDGREMFADVDWRRTRAYSVGFASLYVNLKGREKRGIVQRGDEYEALCTELIEKLRAMADPATGNKMIHGVYRASEHYTGDQAEHAPDLIVGFKAGYRAEDTNVLGGAPAQFCRDNTSLWTGDHLMDPSVVPGILASNRKINRDDPRNVDVAATILQCFKHVEDLKVPEDLDGEPLLE